MSDFLAQGPQPRERLTDPTVSTKARLFLLAAVCIVGGLALAAGLVIHRASLEQHGIEEWALSVARATVHAADREIAATTARLEALATSPALQAGDLRAFYDQIVATPRPEGTWITLYDPERQLLNTQRPFGTSSLPRTTDFSAASQAAMRRVFERREIIVSPVVWAPVARTHVVSVSVPVVVDGVVTHLMSGVLSERRLGTVLEEQRLPASWGNTLLDRNSITIARAGVVEGLNGRETPAEWAAKLRGPDAQAIFHGASRNGLRVLVASAHSPTSNWTAVVEVPAAFASAPMARALLLLGLGGILLIATALAATVIVARGAERPIRALQIFAAQAGERQREVESRYRTYWEYTDEALFVVRVEEHGKFVLEGLNPAYQRLTGLSSSEVAGREPSECLPPAVAAAVEDRYRRCVEIGAPLRYEEKLKLPVGVRDWEISLAPVCDPASGRVIRLLGSGRDITDRRRAETALQHLGGRLLTMQDDERRRIARELHDSTAQLLLAASFAVARVSALAPDLPEQTNRAAEEALSLIEESQREIRTLAYLLHPPMLDEMGLPAALRWYAKGLALRSGMAIRVEAELMEHRLPLALETALFRVAQEALANAHRHSGATNVEVRLSARVWENPGGGVLTLTVRDDGRGLPECHVALPGDDNEGPGFGVGVVGMTERMRQLGGSLSIGPGYPSGTVVEAVVPVAQPTGVPLPLVLAEAASLP